MTTTPPPADRTDAPKKRYETPKLAVYGDLRQITQTVSNTGNADGGHGSMSRTG